MRYRVASVRPTLGMDPEFFLVNDQEEVVPADHVLPPQHKAIVLPRENGGYGPKNMVYRDGIQAEIAVGPSHCRAYVCDNLLMSMRVLHGIAKQHGLKVVCEPSLPITKATLDAARDPRSREFGCEPELMTRLGGAPHIVDVPAATHLRRYAGGHIHVGVTGVYPVPMHTAHGRLECVKANDLILGPIHVLLQSEADRVRRQMYGLAGTYRETPYGFEYRVPSNTILRHSALTNLFLTLARVATGLALLDLRKKYFGDISDELLTAIIDAGDRKRAYEVFLRLKPFLLAQDESEADLMQKNLAALEYTIDRGLEHVVPQDIEQNWNLNGNTHPFHGSHTQTWRQFVAAHWDADMEEYWANWTVEGVHADV